eukprot:3088662-Pleurochrysis_carterae.AAC.1
MDECDRMRPPAIAQRTLAFSGLEGRDCCSPSGRRLANARTCVASASCDQVRSSDAVAYLCHGPILSLVRFERAPQAAAVHVDGRDVRLRVRRGRSGRAEAPGHR